MPDPSRDKSSDSKPPPSRAWIGYIVITVVALAISGVFQRGGLRTVSYDEALALVEQGKVAEAAVEPDEVVLKQKAEGKQPAEEVRVTRLPGVWDEPLLKSLLDHKVKLDAQIPKSPLWTQALVWILPLVAINALFFFALRKMGGAGGVGGPLGALKSRAKIYDRNAEQQVHFDDVAGVDEAKDELEEVVAFLREPERYRALGGKIPRGILLIGPPGTGKTLLARAVAGEAKVPFFSLNASEFVEMFVGLGAARVRDVFEQAKKQAPSIVFVDEIDAVGRTRGGSMALASHDEREQTLHQLLAELDGFDARTTVIMMAATNRPEVLDPALLRPGRFDRQVVVNRPELAGRRAILGVHARGLPLDPAVDLDAVARRTPGMSGADLANVVNEAALSGARRGGKTITPADFAEAIDRAQLGLKRRGAIMTAAERKRVAYHETGHALVALGLPNADPVERVSIIARTIGALGHTLQVPRDNRHVVTEQELETRVTVLLAGRAAEELALGEVSTGAHDDLAKATDIVRNMVTRLGMSRHLGLPTLARNAGAPLLGLAQEERMMSEATAREVDEEVRERLAELYRKAKQLLAEGRAGLDAGAEALVQRETLSGDELAEIADAALIRANNERARGGSAA